MEFNETKRCAVVSAKERSSAVIDCGRVGDEVDNVDAIDVGAKSNKRGAGNGGRRVDRWATRVNYRRTPSLGRWRQI